MTKLQSGRRKSITSSIPMCKGILDPKIVKFAPGEAEDEKAHKKFHNTYTQGLPFKGWTNERVIHVLNCNEGRIILVLQTDPPAQKKKRIVGCLVAEPIKEAFKVISCSSAASSYGSRKKEMNPSSTSLQSGNIIFRREVGKSACLVNE